MARLVYVIQQGEHGPVKVGIGEPESRLRELQVGNPERLRLRVTHPGGIAFERMIHASLADERLMGEWFRSGERVERLVRGLRRNVAAAEERGWCERCGLSPVGASRRRYCSERCLVRARRDFTAAWKAENAGVKPEMLICRDDGGGGNRTRVTCKPETRVLQGKTGEGLQSEVSQRLCDTSLRFVPTGGNDPQRTARAELELALIARDGSSDCFYCGRKNAWCIDHVVPTKRGGPDTIDNLVFACSRCNFEKSSAPVWYFIFRAVARDFPGFGRNAYADRAPLEPSLAVSPGETRVCAHQRGEA